MPCQKIRATVVAIIMVTGLALPGIARAANVLYSPVIATADTFVCRILNVGGKDITVAMEIRDVGGTLLEGSSVTLAPGKSWVIDHFLTTGYCRFAGNFSKSSVRASAENFEDGRSILVVPAQ